MKRVYLTTPIYYVNDVPHIGSCYTNIVSDVLARLYTLKGYEVRLQAGTDEHGQKIERAAAKNGLSNMQFCNAISEKFRDLIIDMNICCAYPKFDSGKHFNQFAWIQANRHSNTLFDSGRNFIRTTEGRDTANGEINKSSKECGRHVKAVEKLWRQLEANGWLYQGQYSGWYSVQEEVFYKEAEITIASNGDRLSTLGAVLEWHEEKVYFFKLSVLQRLLLDLHENSDILQPVDRKPEVCSFIRSGLSDLCVSRVNVQWGIPVPTDTEQTIYVWIDALANYISALDYGSNDESLYEKWWQNSDDIIHIIGKDILRFHAVYWPALLIAAKYPLTELLDAVHNKDDQVLDLSEYKKLLPSTILVHGWWTNDGNKISKSLGNTVDPYQEISWLQDCFKIEHEIAVDYFRYFLVRAMPLGNDGDYSRSRLVGLINAELVNNIGNFVYRSLPMIGKYCDKGRSLIGVESELNREYYHQLENVLTGSGFNDIIECILQPCTAGNKYIEDHKPWNMLKIDEDGGKLYTVLRTVLERVVHINILLRPFIPTIADRVLDYVNWPVAQRDTTWMRYDNRTVFINALDNALSIGLTQPGHFYPSLRVSK